MSSVAIKIISANLSKYYETRLGMYPCRVPGIHFRIQAKYDIFFLRLLFIIFGRNMEDW